MAYDFLITPYYDHGSKCVGSGARDEFFKNSAYHRNFFSTSPTIFEDLTLPGKCWVLRIVEGGNFKVIEWLTGYIWHFARCFVCTVLFNLHLTLPIIHYPCHLEYDRSEAHDLVTCLFLEWHPKILHPDDTDAEEAPDTLPVITSSRTNPQSWFLSGSSCLISKSQCCATVSSELKHSLRKEEGGSYDSRSILNT